MRENRRISETRGRQNAVAAGSMAFGVVCGLLSAVGYTAANTFLRAVTDCDPMWVSCVKAAPTVALVGPWLLVQALAGRPVLPPRKALAALAAAGLLGQLFGNVLFQWSLGVVGLALTTPLTLGTIILAGAVLGRIFLHDPLTLRTIGSIVVLTVAITVLSWGAGEAYRSVAAPPGAATAVSSAPLLAAGVAAACLAGLVYAVLSVVIRYGVTGKTTIAATIFTVSLVGLLSLGPMSYLRLGWEGIQSTSAPDLTMMLLAGLCNAAAFLTLTKSLQLITVVHVNALGSTQIAMAALIGVLFFGEALTAAMVIGVVLTTVGLVLMDQGRKKKKRKAIGAPPLETARPEEAPTPGESVAVEAAP